MRRSHTICIQINFPYERAYRYLVDPANYSDWAGVVPETFQRLPNGDWEGELTSGGHRHFRFSLPNAYGVLDHAMFIPGGEVLWTPMRVSPNEEGTELSFTFFQREGMDDEAFESALVWIETDFLALKSLLETIGGTG